MKAFHNDPEVQKKYLDRIHAHSLADEFIKGRYWENGKGCAVGCTIHSDNHSAYEAELGVPEWLARVEDRIFEGLPLKRAKKWPVEFLEAINIGSELNKIKAPFLIFVLESALTKFDHDKYLDSKKAIEDVIEYWQADPEGSDKERARTLRAAAAAAAADAAAAAAAYAADAAAAAAAYAAYAAAAAYAADAAAAAAYAAAYPAAAAREQEYMKFADKLLELIKECKAND